MSKARRPQNGRGHRSERDYEVGRGKPPLHTRFKPGQSGNPKGRPKGVRNFKTDRFLNEGDQVRIGELTFDILHCPGHSPGSVVYFSKELRFAHVGDVLFNGSVGRTDLPGGSHATLIRSIKEKLLPLGDDVGFICGHGAGSSIGQERMTNPFISGQF